MPQDTPFTPFSGPPYKISEINNINNHFLEYKFGIDLIQELILEDHDQGNFTAFCVTPAYPDGVHINTEVGATDYKLDYKKRTAILYIPDDSNSLNPAPKIGHYTCQFKFVLPEGTFLSDSIEFDLKN